MASMSLQAAYDQARRWIETNDPERASGLAQHILTQYPSNLEAYRILGEAYLATRQFERAQEAFERVLRSDPENIPAHVGLGITYERQGHLDRAVPEFELAWEIKPDMAELRSQLLRLYAEAWGNENAQLRLSRAGLARLYAKGHMLPQAIAEFRQVLNDQPGRSDAEVALAEALWRDGQEEEAITLCREILAKQPESLKANLILGYLELAAGLPQGQRYWEVAGQIDPFLTVARAMFETLPVESTEEPMLEEWDEAAWREQHGEEPAEVPATRPMPVAATTAGSRESDAFLPGSWFDQSQEPVPSTGSTFDPSESDDFLAELLSLEHVSEPAAQPVSPRITQTLPAVDLQDIDTEAATPPRSDAPDTTQAAPAKPSGFAEEEEEPTPTPFSLADLGLSEDELAGLSHLASESAGPEAEKGGQAAPAAPQPSARADEDEPTLTPFSLADLGLSEEEIASLDDLNAQANAGQTSAPTEAAGAPASALASDEIEPAFTPFSLDDLNLSEEEIAGLNNLSAEPEVAPAAPAPAAPEEAPDVAPAAPAPPAPAAAEEELDFTPFSLTDLGLSEDEIASLNSLSAEPEVAPAEAGASVEEAPEVAPAAPAPPAPAAAEEELDFTPFSLTDLGLSEDEIASLHALQSGQDAGPVSQESPPASQPEPVVDPSASKAASELDALPADLRPFSLDEIDLSVSSEAGALPATLQPFSLDEPAQPPRATSESQGGFGNLPAVDDVDALLQSTGFSWQQPAQRSKLGALKSGGQQAPSEEDLSIFAKLRQRKQSVAATTPQAPAGVAPGQDSVEEPLLFSLDDVSLRGDEAPPPITPAESEPPAVQAEGDVQADTAAPISTQPDTLEQPFVQADSTVQADIPAPFGAQSGAEEAPATDTRAPSDEVESLQDAIASGQIQPFSLADLGLTEEEIAELGLGSAIADESQAAPTVREAAPEASAPPVPPVESPATPETGTAATATPDDDLLVAHDLKPFSLSDLGLSDEEIVALGLGPSADTDVSDEGGLGITEEELASLDLGEHWGQSPPLTPAQDQVEQGQPTTADAPTAMPGADPIVERLIALGRQQGYVDISDIIAGVEDPEKEAHRIEEIGRLLHQAHIPIHDGDEVVDMDEEYAPDEDFAGSAAADSTGLAVPTDELLRNEPDMPTLPYTAREPASASDETAVPAEGDLITASDEQGQPAAAPPDEVPEDMTPFSLSDLGLSEEEITALDMHASTGTPIRSRDETLDLPAPTFKDEGSEPEPSTTGETPAEAEPDMTPFSLDELGLSDEEIAAFGALGEPHPAAPEESDLRLAQADTAPAEEAAPATTSQPASQPQPPIRPDSPAGMREAAPATLAQNALDLSAYLRRLETEPQNHILRLSIARLSGQVGASDQAVQHYRHLIKQNALLEDVIEDLLDLIPEVSDQRILHRLHRMLGDAYSKQGRIDEAIQEYMWAYNAGVKQ